MRFETIASQAGNRPDVAIGASGIAALAEHPGYHELCLNARRLQGRGTYSSELIRLSVGLENADDFIEDLEQVLDRL